MLVDDDVLAAAGDDEAPGPAEHAEGDLVGHDPGGDEEGGGLAHPLGVGLLERVDGRVLAVVVVADLGLGHGPAHLGGGLGDGVAAEIDEARGHGRMLPGAPTGARGARRRVLAAAVGAGASGTAGAGAEGGVAVGGVGQFGIGRRHPAEELPGVGGVAGPLVEVGQDVPLADVAVARVAAGSGRRRPWPGPRRRRSACVGRRGRRRGPCGPRPGCRVRGSGAELVQEGGHPSVAVQRPVAVHHHGELAGVVAAEECGPLRDGRWPGSSGRAGSRRGRGAPGRRPTRVPGRRGSW